MSTHRLGIRVKAFTMALVAGVAMAFLPTSLVGQDMAAVAQGAALYGQTCVRCHSARSPTERMDREWVTIVNHMRARANMTKTQAKALIAFLQFSNVPEGAAAPAVPASQASAPASTVGPTVVLLDLTDPRLSAETRAALERYLRTIGNN